MKKLSFPTVKLGNFICEVKEKVKNSGISQDDFTVYGVTNTDVNNKYLKIISNSRYFRQLIEVPIRTTTGVKNINASEVSRLLIALPPLQEQERIVAKFELLNTLCNKLEETVSKAYKYSSQLMEAVLQEAFSVQEAAKPAQVIEFHQL